MGRPSKYPAELRREAVELVKASDRPRAEVARSLGLADSMLKNWVEADRSARVRAENPDGLSQSERDEWSGCVGRTPSSSSTARSCARPPHFSPERRHGEPLPRRL